MKSLKLKKPLYKYFSMPHALTILFIILAIVGFVSWFTSGIKYEVIGEGGKIIQKETKTAGITEWFMALFVGFQDGFWLVIFIFVLGIWIQMIIKSQALEALVGKLGKNFKSDFKKIDINLKYKNKFLYYTKLLKEGIRQTWMFLPLMIFFSFAGSTAGSAEETVAYYPILIPLIFAAGFDIWTGFLIIFVGTGVGVMGSTVNPFSILTAIGASNSGLTEKIVTASDGQIIRWLAWIFFSIVTFIYVMWYGARVKMNKEKSYFKDLFEIHKKDFGKLKDTKNIILTKKRIAIVIIFLATFIILVFSVLPFWGFDSKNWIWDGRPSTKFFFNSPITNKITNMGWTLFVFGKWYFPEITLLFFITAILIGILDWKGEKDFVNNSIVGMKELIVVALAIGMARSISVLLNSVELKDLLVLKISEIIKNSKGIKVITIPILSYIFFIPLTFLIPSTSGLANAVFPILGPSIEKISPLALSGAITSYGWASGFANMFVPTYGVVIGALAVSKIQYNRFLKAIWKYLLIMFIVGFIFVLLGGTITYLTEKNTFF